MGQIDRALKLVAAMSPEDRIDFFGELEETYCVDCGDEAADDEEHDCPNASEDDEDDSSGELPDDEDDDGDDGDPDEEDDES